MKKYIVIRNIHYNQNEAGGKSPPASSLSNRISVQKYTNIYIDFIPTHIFIVIII